MKSRQLNVRFFGLSLLCLICGVALAACSPAAPIQAQATNPLEDIRNAQLIESVFLRGKYFSRQDLDRLLLEAKQLAQQPAPESTK